MFIELAFGILGGGIKFVDDALDEGIFNKKIAIMLTPFLVALWIFLCIQNKYAATILTAILLSVILGGKIDNKVFLFCTLAIIGAILIFGNGLMWIPLIFLALLGVIDEKGNDYVDRKRTNIITDFFFKHRMTMKLGIFILYLLNIIPLNYALAFLLFDIAYDAVGFTGKYKVMRTTYNIDLKSFILAELHGYNLFKTSAR